MGRGKNKRRKQDKRKQEKRKARGAAAASSGFAELEPWGVPISPLAPLPAAGSRPPVFLSDRCRSATDPYTPLGLEAGDPSPEAVRAAFNARIVEHPPEQEPETARALIEARDRLLDARYLLERVCGTIRPPDPAHWDLTTTAPAPRQTPARGPERLPAADRLVGQLVLYAMLADEWRREEEEGGGRKVVQPQSLF